MPIYLKIMQVAAVTHSSYSLFLHILDKHPIILYKYYILNPLINLFSFQVMENVSSVTPM